MALAKQIVPVSFAQGIDTKTDPRQLVLGKLRHAENIVYESIQALVKRNGYTDLQVTGITGQAKVLTKFLYELCAFDDTQMYAYSSSSNSMVAKGSIGSVLPESVSISRTAVNQDSVDVCVVGTYEVYTWHQIDSTTDNIYYSIIDTATRTFIADTVLIGTGKAVRAANVGTTIYFVYYDKPSSTPYLRYKTINLSAPSTVSSATTLTNVMDTSHPYFDIVSASNNSIYIAFMTTAGTKLKVTYVSPFGDGPIVDLTSAHGATGSIDIFVDSLLRVVVSWGDIANEQYYYAILSATLNSVLLAATSLASITGGAVNMINTVTEIATSSYLFIFRGEAVGHSTPFITAVKANASGSVTASYNNQLGLTPFSKPIVYNGNVYIVGMYASTLQTTYFLLQFTGNSTPFNIVSKFSPSLAGGLDSMRSVSSLSAINSTQFVYGSQIRTKNISDNGTFFGIYGVNRTLLDFAPQNPHNTATLGQNMHISGGVLSMYDGKNAVEHGFHIYPETLIAGSGGATTGGHISNGTYSYIAVYAWSDTRGYVHRSAPSNAYSVTASGGTSTQIISVQIPACWLTAKSNVIMELYRTEAAGTIYYKVSSTTAPTLNDPTAEYIQINDTLADATIISNEVLYTTGGVLDNIAATSASLVAVHTASNRIFYLGEDPNTLFYSKIRNEGAPVEFNDTLYKQFNPEGGRITAFTSMDEKLIVFEKDAIYYLSGTGPDNLGQQDTFTDPELVASDVGCIEPRSVVFTPIGIFFKSRKGIYLLNRGLQLSYIGAPMEEFNGLTITSAKIIPTKNQVRFLTSDGPCLVYNYHLNEWGTFTNHAGLSSEVVETLGSIADANYYYLRTDGSLWQENTSTFSDNGSAIKFRIETGWMSFNQLQGFMRAYKMLLIGTWKSSHKLRIKFAYDFNEAWQQDVIIDPATFLDVAPYGSESPYGSGTPYGSDGSVYQARVDLAKQKCQAIKVSIEDVQATPGEGLSLTGITFQVGGKDGLFKVSTSRKFGSS